MSNVEEFRNLTCEIWRSSQDRHAQLAALRAQVYHDMDQTRAARQDQQRTRQRELQSQTAAFLNNAQRARSAMGRIQRENLRLHTQRLANRTAQILHQDHQDQAEMAQQEREQLMHFRADLHQEVANTVAQLQTAHAQVAENIHALGQVWPQFVRGAQAGEVTCPPAGKPQKMRQPPKAKAAAHAPAAPPEGRLPTSQEIRRYLASNPRGVRLAELGEHFGTAHIRLVPLLSDMLKAHAVRKDEATKRYFAA